MISFVQVQLQCQIQSVEELIRAIQNHFPGFKEDALAAVKEAHKNLTYAALSLDNQLSSIVRSSYENQTIKDKQHI